MNLKRPRNEIEYHWYVLPIEQDKIIHVSYAFKLLLVTKPKVEWRCKVIKHLEQNKPHLKFWKFFLS